MSQKEKSNKRDKVSQSYVTIVNTGEKYVIRDTEAGSKAWVPIVIDEGVQVEVVQVDKGLINYLPKGEEICDNLVFTLQNSKGPQITWIIELKGSKNPKEAKHAISQIEESIQHLQNEELCPSGMKYIEKRDYVMAAIVGAPKKTIPIMNDDEIKSLCRKLRRMSGKRVRDMFSLFCQIRLADTCKTVQRRGDRPPYEYTCYNKTGTYINFPSELMKGIM